MTKQKGFSLVEGLLIVLILCVVGFAGWFVWDRNKNDDASESAQNTQQSETKTTDTENSAVVSDFVVPEGWKTITEKGVTASYPEVWDKTDISSGKFIIHGVSEDSIIPVSFDFPLGYEYLGNEEWKYISTSEDYPEPSENGQPKKSTTIVDDSESTITIGSAEGGCVVYKIGFVVDKKVYSISLPMSCNSEMADNAGVAEESIIAATDQIIESISVN